jgi:hypothetical protein
MQNYDDVFVFFSTFFEIDEHFFVLGFEGFFDGFVLLF